jgi:hypothetical protein
MKISAGECNARVGEWTRLWVAGADTAVDRVRKHVLVHESAVVLAHNLGREELAVLYELRETGGEMREKEGGDSMQDGGDEWIGVGKEVRDDGSRRRKCTEEGETELGRVPNTETLDTVIGTEASTAGWWTSAEGRE